MKLLDVIYAAATLIIGGLIGIAAAYVLAYYFLRLTF